MSYLSRRNLFHATAAGAAAATVPTVVHAHAWSGPNDARLWELVEQHTNVIRRREYLSGLEPADLASEREREDQLERVVDEQTAILEKAAGIQPDTMNGATALVRLVEQDRIDGKRFREQAQRDSIAAIVDHVFSATKQAGEVA